jgi:uncharacterized protein (TIGR00725 family)
MLKRNAQATIIGDSDASRETCLIAEKIGLMVAKHGITVVTGGRGGVMEAACRGARNAGGITIGILPTEKVSDANKWCSIVIPTGMGHARNVLTVLGGDFIIALGDAAGTLSEICFAWIYNKPILTLKGYAGWLNKFDGDKLDHRRSEPIVVCENIDHLEKEVLSICRKHNLNFIG